MEIAMNKGIKEEKALEWSELRGYHLKDIYKVKRYSSTRLFRIQFLNPAIDLILQDNGEYPLGPKETFSAKHHKKLKEILDEVEKDLDYLNLSFSSKYFQAIRKKINATTTAGELSTEVEILSKRIDDELELIAFGFIPKDAVVYYDQPELFGTAVYTVFPKARDDIREAGNCLAHFLFNASVFHLMRTVEIGAKAMVRELSAQKFLEVPASVNGSRQMVRRPVELCDWKTLSDGLHKALVTLESGTKTSVAKKEKLEFYSHAVSQFRNFKDAWRNKVAHARTDYNHHEVKDIMNNARQFMQHLAKRVKPSK
jgi:hypothetical protein